MVERLSAAGQHIALPDAIMITGTDDHDPPETMITINWIERSRWSGIGDHDDRNPQSDTWFPNAPKIALVQDNLSTHKPASLYEAFPAAEARRIAERFEWHYTPKQGSWLNMAETELSVLSGQCLDRRIPDKAMLTEEAAAWTAQRNKKHAKADWQFTTADARVKLKRLYPSI